MRFDAHRKKLVTSYSFRKWKECLYCVIFFTNFGKLIQTVFELFKSLIICHVGDDDDCVFEICQNIDGLRFAIIYFALLKHR